MKTTEYTSHSEEDTRKLGRDFAAGLRPGLVVLLYGDLGAGKTVFVRGVCEALGISGVRSPSFTLVNEYTSPSGVFVAHVDLYRLETFDVHTLGLEEYDYAVMFIEWPERWTNPPKDAVRIYFTATSENERKIREVMP